MLFSWRGQTHSHLGQKRNSFLLFSHFSSNFFKTREIIATLKGHQRKVNCLYVLDEFLYSASDDGTVIVWNKIVRNFREIFINNCEMFRLTQELQH